MEKIWNLVLESDENGAESRSRIHERSVRRPGEPSSRVHISVDSFGVAAGSVSPEIAFFVAVVKTTENIEMFSISDGRHFFEGERKADSLNPGSESPVGSVVLAVLGEELDVRMVVVGENVAVVAESSAAHDDDVSFVVLHCCLDVGESQPWLALPNDHIGRTPASAILVFHAVVNLVSRICWRAHDRSFLISLSGKTLLEASARVLLHRVRKFLVDTVHDNVESARSLRELHDCSLDVQVAAEFGLGSTVISTTDEVRLALNDDRASIVSPIAVDVESCVCISESLGEFCVCHRFVVSPLEHGGGVTREDENMVTVDGVNFASWGRSNRFSCRGRSRLRS